MDKTLRQRVSLANPVHLLALGLGSGLSPKMPGTVGTLASIPLVAALSHFANLSSYLAFTAIACIVGIWLCGKTAEDMGVHDDASIVWDEIAGMLLTMIAVPLTWQTLMAGFLLFRVFDIAKPWPISYCDKQLHGGVGIMLDDILAGVAACACLHVLIMFAIL